MLLSGVERARRMWIVEEVSLGGWSWAVMEAWILRTGWH